MLLHICDLSSACLQYYVYVVTVNIKPKTLKLYEEKKERIVEYSYETAKSNPTDITVIRVQPYI